MSALLLPLSHESLRTMARSSRGARQRSSQPSRRTTFSIGLITPQTAFQFEHQLLQEYYAALDVCARLLDLRDDDHDATRRFTADYVNDPAGPNRCA